MMAGAPCATPTSPGGYGDGDSAGGQGVEVVARMEAEEMRWRCSSAQCNADNNNYNNDNNSYHKRCLEPRPAPTRTSGKSAGPRRAPKEQRHGGPGGQEAPSGTVIGGGGGENGPARSLHPKFEMMAEKEAGGGCGGGGEGLREVAVLKGEEDAMAVEACESGVDGDVEVGCVTPAAGVGGEAAEDDGAWEVEYTCPACKGVVATQEQVDSAQQG